MGVAILLTNIVLILCMTCIYENSKHIEFLDKRLHETMKVVCSLIEDEEEH